MTEKTKAFLKIESVLVGIIIVCACLLLFCSCRTTEYIEVEKIRTDTLIETLLMYDSIHIHDSIHIKEKGDSVWEERWHTKYIEKILMDTIYQATHDTIPKPYPVTKEVPAQLSNWQKTRLYIANALLIAIVIYLLYYFIFKRRTFHN
jgi:hypothetical protein